MIDYSKFLDSYSDLSIESKMLCIVMLAIVMISYWIMFTKCDEKGWKALIPIYNVYISIKLFWGGSPWKILLFFIPIVNSVANIILLYKIGKSFGSTALGILNIFFSFFVLLWIAISKKAIYKGPGGESISN